MNFVKLSRYDLYGYLIPGMLLVALPYSVCPCCITKLCGDINEWVLAGFYLLISYIVGMFYGKILLNYLKCLFKSNPSLRAKRRKWKKSKHDALYHKFAKSTIECIQNDIKTEGINEIYNKAWTLIEDKISEQSQAIEAQQILIVSCTPISVLYALAFAIKFAFFDTNILYLWITGGVVVLGFIMVKTYKHINNNFPSIVWEAYLWDQIKNHIKHCKDANDHKKTEYDDITN